MTCKVKQGKWIEFVRNKFNFICEDEAFLTKAFKPKQNCIFASSKSSDERPYCLVFTGGKRYFLRLCFMKDGKEVYTTISEDLPESLRTRETTVAEVRDWWYKSSTNGGIKILESLDD